MNTHWEEDHEKNFTAFALTRAGRFDDVRGILQPQG